MTTRSTPYPGPRLAGTRYNHLARFRRPSIRRARYTIAALSLLVAGVLPLAQRAQRAAAATCNLSSLNVVAHQDDDLLFLNPDVQADINAGKCVTTVFVTSGDGGGTLASVLSRENGTRVAYATMARVANAWSSVAMNMNGQIEQRWMLSANPNVSLIFLRLPDGGGDGAGFSANGFQSLQKLWDGRIASVSSKDGHSSYSRATLISALGVLLNSFNPNSFRIQNFSRSYGTGDHSDHITAAKFAYASDPLFAGPHTVLAYRGYDISGSAANLVAAEISLKQQAFFAYASYDSVCGSVTACVGTSYESWLSRRYLAYTENVDPSASRNIALHAVATASSEAPLQTAGKAIDGVAAGYPTDSTKEWATIGGRTGSWIDLRWDPAQTVDRVVLFDRPNLSENITSGTITFSDGSIVSVGALANDGSATTVSFDARSATRARFTVTGVSTTTGNVGLAEFQVWSVGAPVVASASPTIPTILPPPSTQNLALSATASASSETPGQTAAKAIDGVATGYPTEYSKEWATLGGKSGSWIELRWTSPQAVDGVSLFDRPNLADNVTSGTLTFSDGSMQNVGALNNDGSSTPVSFAARSVTSVRFTVTGVSAGTTNAGLAEFQVWASVSNPVPATTTTVGTTTTTVGTTTTTVVAPTSSTSPPPSSVNVALSSTASASSEAPLQGAAKAIDGVASGYPADFTREWATIGGQTGSWIELKWSSAQRVDRVVLFDRPNLTDTITSGTLSFSDGSTTSVGALNNDGSASTVRFPARTITSLRFIVNGVGVGTGNVGLAELQVWAG